MRQVGILAAACHVSLDKMIDRLQEDHETAKQLAVGLSRVPGIKVFVPDTKTNMVFFDSALPELTRSALVDQLKAQGVLVGVEARLGIRAVTHYGISAQDISQVLSRVESVLSNNKIGLSV